jgi:hypothetical protein
MHADLLKTELKEKGFARVPAVLSDDEVANLRLRAHGTLFRQSSGHRARYASNGSLCNLADNPEYVDLISHPRAMELLRTIGPDPRWTSGYLISKPPGGPPLFWHQDWWGWNTDLSYRDEAAQLFFMYYLADTTRENGCLRVIPGSHRRRHPLHDLPVAHNETLARATDLSLPAFADHPDEVAVEVCAGDLVIGDSRLLHGAYRNLTGNERPLMTLWYIPDFGGLPPSVRARLTAIYRRQELDLEHDDTPLTPDDWPPPLRARLGALAPDFADPAVAPEPWQRAPLIERLASA